MKDCWTILGLRPTADLGAIKRAYREQVKLYHPDTVRAPEKKRRYTIICAEINQAYKQAIGYAARARATGEDYPFSPAIDPSRACAAEQEKPRPMASISLFRSRPLIGGFLVFMLALQIISFFTGPLTSVPDFVKMSSSLLIALFVALFFYGMLLGGALGLLVIWLFPKRVIRMAGLEKYEEKILWIAAIAANTWVFFFTSAIPSMQDTSGPAFLINGAIRAIAAGTFPAFLALKWLREIAQYRKIKASAGEIPAE